MIVRVFISIFAGAGISLFYGKVGNDFINYSIEYAFRICLVLSAADIICYLLEAARCKIDKSHVGLFYLPKYVTEAKNNFAFFVIVLIIWLSSKAILGSG